MHARLLRTDSGHTEASARGHGRVSQKLHMVNEDLTIVIAGFRTSRIGYALYALLCAATLGTAYLLLRWLPRWQVKLIGAPCPLRECDWVVLENQWGEFAILPISSRPYDRPLSTVFGAPEKMFAHFLEEDADPILSELRVLSYRYVRFFFNPFKDKFVVSTGWKDPSWRRVRSLRAGIESDEKEERASVFGRNLIDIDQKSIPQLLVDEVGYPSLFPGRVQTRVVPAAVPVLLACCLNFADIATGLPPILCVPNRQLGLMVSGPVLLLCRVHFRHVCQQHHSNSCRDSLRKSARYHARGPPS